MAPDDGNLPPEDAFSLLGNEIRSDIVRTLGDVTLETQKPASLPFSELRSRVSTDVRSSQFNYHLQKLAGQFVEQTDDGYRLSTIGLTLYRVIRAGTFTRQVSMDPSELDVDCHNCGGDVVATYADGRFEIRCPECGRRYNYVFMPPSTVEHAETEALLSRVDQYSRHELLASSNGVCHFCVNSLDTEIRRASEMDWEGTDAIDLFVRRRCDHCGYHHYMSIGLALLYEPSLISFCYDHGMDVLRTPIWELEFAMTDNCVTVLDTEPWKIEFRLTIDRNTLLLLVDETLTILEHERIER